MNEIYATISAALPEPLASYWPVLLAILSAIGLFAAGRGPFRRRDPDAPGAAEAPLYQMRPVLNAAERRLQREIERVMPAHFHARARLLAQVSLSEFIYAPAKADYLAISAQRVDFLIVDQGFRPICAIEYQGAGHFGPSQHSRNRTRSRDFSKRRALRVAGVPLVEIPEAYDTSLLSARLGDVTGRHDLPEPARPPRRADRLRGA